MINLPKAFSGEVHFYYWPDLDCIVLREAKREGKDFIYLGSKHVEASFSVTDEDAVKQMVGNLKQKKKKIQAIAQTELNRIDDKINSLLAITHQDGGVL